MNSSDLAAIKERAEKATPGPYTVDEYIGEDPYDYPDEPFVELPNGVKWAPDKVSIPAACQTRADAEFFAHSREDIPLLLSEVERLRGIVEKVAKRDDPVDKLGYCRLCGESVWTSITDHEPTCPYRLASEYVKEEGA